MLRFRKLFCAFALTLPVASLLSCGSAHDSDEYFVLVAANLQVPYWQAAGAGFSKAATQFKIRTDYLGPNNYDAKAEREALDKAVQQKATGILLAVTDPALLKDGIDKRSPPESRWSPSIPTPRPASGFFSSVPTTIRLA